MTPTKAYPKMDLTGQVFGEWTVLSFYGNYGKAPAWVCRCECGFTYNIRQFELFKGNFRSCEDLNIRRGWVEKGIGYLPLTKGKVALVSPHRLKELEQWPWYAVHLGGGWYAYRQGMKYVPGEGEKGIQMGRQILGLGPAGIDKREADHANGNSLDNRDENLRPATRRQNETNKAVRRDNRTGIKGVRRARWGNKETGRFEARITHMGVEIHLGMTDTAEEGGRLYEEASRKLFGEFARA